MYCLNLENERLEAETYLCGRRRDFTTTYMRVANLQYIIVQQPEIVGESTVSALCQVLEGTEHLRQRQVFFLFKKRPMRLPPSSPSQRPMIRQPMPGGRLRSY